MSNKKIEPTGVMVDEAANILCLDATHEFLRFHAGMTQHTYRQRARTVMRAALRAALNHPDAADLLAAEWKANAEAAAERAERAEDLLADAVHVDEAARRVEAARERGWDDAADWVKKREAWTDEELRAANPHRPVQELPTASCTIIVPADGRERVEAMANVVWYANEAALGPDNRWHGVWRAESGLAISSVRPEDITPGTWKVDDQ